MRDLHLPLADFPGRIVVEVGQPDEPRVYVRVSDVAEFIAKRHRDTSPHLLAEMVEREFGTAPQNQERRTS